MPEGIEELTRAARRVKPDVVVWKGDQELPHSQQGLKVLEYRLASPSMSAISWRRRAGNKRFCSTKIPGINDPQAGSRQH